MKQMKILLAILAVTLSAVSVALAHEGHEHAAGSGLFGLPPEYVHVLMNPMPVYGMAMGVLALGAAVLTRNKTAQMIGMGLVIIAAASVWPVAHFGQNAYRHVRGMSDHAGQDALDEHMKRAEKVIYVFYATACAGLVALVTRKKFPKAATPLAAVTLVMGVASLGAGGWISKAGGQIRHPEFRAMTETATNAEPHEHGESEHAHEPMQPAYTNGDQHQMQMSDQTAATNATAHQHNKSEQSHEMMESTNAGVHKHEMQMPEQTTATNAAQQHNESQQSHETMQSTTASGHMHQMQMPDQTAGQTSLPDTVAGVWKEIHEHHAELAASVNAKQFQDVQLHARKIGALAKRLAELAPAAENGASKITHAVDELESSAETGSDTVMKMRFKEFEAALNELEQRMKQP